jgi:phenylpyruvate tautomerase PptA (4-oxalocrotonate tautomerase family)
VGRRDLARAVTERCVRFVNDSRDDRDVMFVLIDEVGPQVYEEP